LFYDPALVKHRVLWLRLIGWLILGGVACDGARYTAPPPDAAACTGAWQVVLPAQTGFSRDLQWRDGILCFARNLFTPLAIESVSADGSDRRTLVEGRFERLWVEPEQLILFEEGVFYAAPRTGGEARLLFDTGVPTREHRDVALDAQHFYWTVEGSVIVDPAPQTGPRAREWTIWRARRDGGGTPEPLATIPTVNNGQILEVLPDAFLVDDTNTRSGDNISVISKAGGSPRSLPAPPRLGWVLPMGWSEQEVLWAVREQPVGLSKAIGLQRVAVASGVVEPEPFAELPLVDESLAWPTGSDRGWIVAGDERFGDGEHKSVWSVDASGRTARLACAPAGEEFYYVLSDARAITADAVYVFAIPNGAVVSGPPNGWSLVRIARNP
jgi:hypothetical protein